MDQFNLESYLIKYRLQEGEQYLLEAQNDAVQVEYAVVGAINLRNSNNLPYDGDKILTWWEKNNPELDSGWGIDGLKPKIVFGVIRGDAVKAINGMYSFSKNWTNAYRAGGDHSIGKADIVADLDGKNSLISVKSSDNHKWGKESSPQANKETFVGVFKTYRKYYPNEFKQFLLKDKSEKSKIIKDLRTFSDRVKDRTIQDNTQVVKTLSKFNAQVIDKINSIAFKPDGYNKLIKDKIIDQNDLNVDQLKKTATPLGDALSPEGLIKVIKYYEDKFTPEIIKPAIEQLVASTLYPKWSQVKKTYYKDFEEYVSVFLKDPKLKEILVWNLITDEGKNNKLDFMLRNGIVYDLRGGFESIKEDDWFQSLVKRTQLGGITQPGQGSPYQRIEKEFRDLLSGVIDNNEAITRVGTNLIIQVIYKQFVLKEETASDDEIQNFRKLIDGVFDSLIKSFEDENPLNLILSLV